MNTSFPIIGMVDGITILDDGNPDYETHSHDCGTTVCEYRTAFCPIGIPAPRKVV
jgi:hypothetical protein